MMVNEVLQKRRNDCVVQKPRLLLHEALVAKTSGPNIFSLLALQLQQSLHSTHGEERDAGRRGMGGDVGAALSTAP